MFKFDGVFCNLLLLLVSGEMLFLSRRAVVVPGVLSRLGWGFVCLEVMLAAFYDTSLLAFGVRFVLKLVGEVAPKALARTTLTKSLPVEFSDV